MAGAAGGAVSAAAGLALLFIPPQDKRGSGKQDRRNESKRFASAVPWGHAAFIAVPRHVPSPLP